MDTRTMGIFSETNSIDRLIQDSVVDVFGNWYSRQRLVFVLDALKQGFQMKMLQ